MAEPSPRAMVMIVTSTSEDPAAMTHARAWPIDPATVDAFTQALTEKYGRPVAEGLTTIGALQARVDRDAGDGIVYAPGDPDA